MYFGLLKMFEIYLENTKTPLPLAVQACHFNVSTLKCIKNITVLMTGCWMYLYIGVSIYFDNGYL